ncbi:MAG: TIGR00282 family metallophosphoesterase [Acidobacteria bacterium]|jgi:2',3'-cyclic-nucleotide 2'-phosphodiesterase|nr:TIGR00282 family metallophosphoesterase [Acidobacteriota bacterium]
MTNLLFIGDIVGRPGRDLLRHGLAALASHHNIDLVIANVENSAAGFGVTPAIAEDLFEYGVHVMTGGNHTWDKKEIIPYFSKQPRMIRPANFPEGTPGLGHYVARAENGVAVGVINAMGRVFMTPLDDPFRVVLKEIEIVKAEAALIFVDFHAEATSEKVAMGWHLDGRVTAVVGTHTHVQTADDRVLPKGTAYITDVGMTGPHDSVIGVDRAAIIHRFMAAMPQRFETATENPRLNGVVVRADETTGQAVSISRVNMSLQDLEMLAVTPVAAR